MGLFKPRMTTRFDVATAVVGALLGAFKAYDTARKYKLEQQSLTNKEIKK